MKGRGGNTNNILIVDDHPLVLTVLDATVRAVFPAAQVRSAAGCEEAIEAAAAGEFPEMVLLDLGLPGCAGIASLTRFLAAHPAARVVVVSATETRETVLAAFEAGAAGYIPKSCKPDVFGAALRLVAAGGTYVPPQALPIDEATPAEPVLAEHRGELTERQRDVLRLIARGMGNKEIARHLRIAHDTVKQHAKAVYAALGVAGRMQAARAAASRGIKLD
jgi:DNA-binding NarL/FixJ family response regulator